MKCQQFSDVFEIFQFVGVLLLLEKLDIYLLGLNQIHFLRVKQYSEVSVFVSEMSL
jgi:hypothetical protein